MISQYNEHLHVNVNGGFFLPKVRGSFLRWYISGVFSGGVAQYKKKVLAQSQDSKQQQKRHFHVAASLRSKEGNEDGQGGEAGGSGQGSRSGGEEGKVRPCSNCGGALNIDSKGKFGWFS